MCNTTNWISFEIWTENDSSLIWHIMYVFVVLWIQSTPRNNRYEKHTSQSTINIMHIMHIMLITLSNNHSFLWMNLFFKKLSKLMHLLCGCVHCYEISDARKSFNDKIQYCSTWSTSSNQNELMVENQKSKKVTVNLKTIRNENQSSTFMWWNQITGILCMKKKIICFNMMFLFTPVNLEWNYK